MKNKVIISGIAVAALVALGVSGCATEKHHGCCEKGGKNTEEAKLQAEAKVSKEAAPQTALAKVPGGTVKDGELEREKGKLIWSFDVTVPDSKDIKEVAVDALTGEVVAVDTETAADRAKEAAEDAAKEKQHGKKAKKHDKEDKD